MFRGVVEVLRSDDPRLVKQIRDQDDVVDQLHEAIRST
jgi:phosphate uptake regulator